MAEVEPTDRAALPDAQHRDFGAYNAAQQGRPVRPLARSALAAAGPGEGRQAVELGSGLGIEARFLAGHGWQVLALDQDRAATAALAGEPGISARVADLAAPGELPPHDLLLSCATLSFVRREDFPALWSAIRASLRPGGVLAVDLFGDRDDWAGGDGTFLTAAEVDELLAGFTVLEREESERDGQAFSGPKHWHVHRVVARRGTQESGHADR